MWKLYEILKVLKIQKNSFRRNYSRKYGNFNNLKVSKFESVFF